MATAAFEIDTDTVMNRHRSTVAALSDGHLIEALEALEGIGPEGAWEIIRDEVDRRGL